VSRIYGEESQHQQVPQCHINIDGLLGKYNDEGALSRLEQDHPSEGEEGDGRFSRGLGVAMLLWTDNPR
jgi:hypothetical protein